MRETTANDAVVLGDAIARWHPEPFRGIDAAEFEASVRETAKRIASLDRSGTIVELMRLGALLGDRNGHTGILPHDEQPDPLHFYPLVPYEFGDGIFVVAAASRHLTGLELRAVEGVPADELLPALAPLVSRDNNWTVRARRPLFLVTAEILHGLGIVDAIGPVRFDLRGSGGPVRIELEPRPRGSIPSSLTGLPRREAPAYLTRRDETRWVTLLRDGRAAYVAYNMTRGDLSDFAAEVAALATRPLVGLVVLDLRLNSGGDNRTYGPPPGCSRARDA